jgi:hypothetical protein
MSVAIRVLVADDHALVRGGFRMILEAQPDIEVAGEAAKVFADINGPACHSSGKGRMAGGRNVRSSPRS